MPYRNDLLIRKKLREIKAKVNNMGGGGKKDYTLDDVTITQLATQIEDLLDDRPRPLYVAKELQ